MHVAGLHSPNTRHPRRLHAQAFQALAASTVAVGLALAPGGDHTSVKRSAAITQRRGFPEATHQFSKETTGVTGWSAPQAIDPNDGVLRVSLLPYDKFLHGGGRGRPCVERQGLVPTGLDRFERRRSLVSLLPYDQFLHGSGLERERPHVEGRRVVQARSDRP